MSDREVRGIAFVVILAALAAILLILAYSASQAAPGRQEPDVSVVEQGSPVQIGDDEGRLEASRKRPSSILVACLRDPGQPPVHSQGRRSVGSHVFDVVDRDLHDGCERLNTHTRLRQHWLIQGSLQSQVSNHP